MSQHPLPALRAGPTTLPILQQLLPLRLATMDSQRYTITAEAVDEVDTPVVIEADTVAEAVVVHEETSVVAVDAVAATSGVLEEDSVAPLAVSLHRNHASTSSRKTHTACRRRGELLVPYLG